MSELTKKSVITFASSSLKTAGTLIITFVMTPILLNLIGAEDFGTFKVLTEIHSYLSLIEMGLLASLVSCMIPLLRGDRERLKELLNEGNRKFRKIGLITVLAGICLLPFLKDLTSWQGENQTDLIITFSLFIATSFLIPFNIYRAYLDASNRGYLVHITNFVQSILFSIIAVAFAYYGFKLKAQGIALLLSGMAGALLLRHFSDIKIKSAARSETFDKQISGNQKSQVLNELAGKLCFQIDQIVIGFFLGPVVVTKVFLGQRVVQIMQQQLISLGHASWASLGSLYYESDTDKTLFQKRMLEMTKLLAVFAVAGLVPICILNQAFIELWVGETFLLDSNALVYIASANAFFFGLFSFWGYIFTVLGKPQAITKLFWIQAIFNVVLSLIATKVFGGIGPIIGTLLSNVLVPMWIYPKLLEKHFRMPLSKLVFSFISPLIVGISILVLYHYGPWKLVHLNWLEFIGSALLIFVSNSTLLFLLIFNQDERNLFLKRLKALLRR